MIALACDHTALEMKQGIKDLLDEMGLEYRDYGTHTPESCDYPRFGYRAAKAVADGVCDRAIILCGTGEGIGMAASKVKGTRVCIASDTYSAELSKRHNNANVLAMGARVLVADLLENRLALAAAYGAERTVNVKAEDLHEACAAFTGGDGFDVCVEACGAPATFLACIEQAAHGANLILIGNGKKETTFVHSVLLKKELNVFGSRNAFTKDFETLIDLVAAGGADVLKMVSGVYDAADAKTAFEALAHNDGTLGKLLIRFAEEDA